MMSPKTAVQKTPSMNLINFDPEAVALIKKTVADTLTDLEFQMFIYQAQRTGLDPMARQIYAIKRGTKVVIQSSIDGLRLVAQRNKDYAGQDEPVFEEVAGKPNIAKVSVYKFAPNGQRYPAAVGVAYWDEYCPSYNGQPSAMWAKMPHVMLAKVAEALALRKAFPQELSGLYTTEEMAQAEPVKPIKEADWIENNNYLKEEPKQAEPVDDVPSRQVEDDPGTLKPEDEKLIKAAEEIFNDDISCTCNTKGKFHKNTCPMWTDTTPQR